MGLTAGRLSRPGHPVTKPSLAICDKLPFISLHRASGLVIMLRMIPMDDLPDLAPQWESSLPESGSPGIDEWVKIFAIVDPVRFAEFDEDEGDDIEDSVIDEFNTAVRPYKLGSISLDFPNSTHGDGCLVSFYVLPRGKSVLISHATWGEGSLPVIYSGTDYDELYQMARDLLFDDRDYGEMVYSDASEEELNEADTIYDRNPHLRSLWKQAIQERKAR